MSIPNVPGLTLVENFVGEPCAEQLLLEIPPGPAATKDRQRGCVQSFFAEGVHVPPAIRPRRTSWQPDLEHQQLTPEMAAVAEAIVDEQLLPQVRMVVMNEYKENDFIGAHADESMVGDSFAILSLLAEATMALTHGTMAPRGHLLTLRPRSLLVLSKDARWKWRHAILPVAERRISLVFRPLILPGE